jgi:hypothetical protein
MVQNAGRRMARAPVLIQSRVDQCLPLRLSLPLYLRFNCLLTAIGRQLSRRDF